MTKEEYINEYGKVLSIKKLAFNTCQTYLGCLMVYLSWCESKDIFPPEITKPQLRDFLSNPNWSASYLKQQRGTIDNFYRYVLGINYIMADMPYPKVSKSLPEYLSPEEVEAIFNAVSNRKQRLILKLQYACALRVHEVVKVKWADFEKTFNGYNLRVFGKGKLDLIPVPDETINEVVAVLGNNFNSSGYLFPGQTGSHYDEQSVRAFFNRAKAQCRIYKEGSTHLLRHSRATHLIQSGVSTRHVQILLRHNSSKTTEVYTHLSKDDLREAFKKADSYILQKLSKEPKILQNNKYIRPIYGEKSINSLT